MMRKPLWVLLLAALFFTAAFAQTDTETESSSEEISSSTTSVEDPTSSTTSEEDPSSSTTSAEPSSSTTSEELTSSTTSSEEPSSSTTSEDPVPQPTDCDLYFVEEEIINENSIFNGTAGWIQDLNGGGDADFQFSQTEAGGLYIDIITPGAFQYNIQLRTTVELVEGLEYRMTVIGKTDPGQTREIFLVTDAEYADIFCGRATFFLTDEFEEYNFCCVSRASGTARLILELGGTNLDAGNDLYLQEFKMTRGAIVLPSTTSTVATSAATTSSTATSTTTDSGASNTLPEISTDDAGISGGALAAIIIVIIAVILAVIIAVVLFWKFRDTDEDSKSGDEEMKAVPVKGGAAQQQGEEDTETSTQSSSASGSGSSESGSESGSGSGSESGSSD